MLHFRPFTERTLFSLNIYDFEYQWDRIKEVQTVAAYEWYNTAFR